LSNFSAFLSQILLGGFEGGSGALQREDIVSCLGGMCWGSECLELLDGGRYGIRCGIRGDVFEDA